MKNVEVIFHFHRRRQNSQMSSKITDVIKIHRCHQNSVSRVWKFLKYILATYRSWCRHQSSFVVKEHHYCKLQLHGLSESWDFRGESVNPHPSKLIEVHWEASCVKVQELYWENLWRFKTFRRLLYAQIFMAFYLQAFLILFALKTHFQV